MEAGFIIHWSNRIGIEATVAIRYDHNGPQLDRFGCTGQVKGFFSPRRFCHSQPMQQVDNWVALVGLGVTCRQIDSERLVHAERLGIEGLSRHGTAGPGGKGGKHQQGKDKGFFHCSELRSDSLS